MVGLINNLSGIAPPEPEPTPHDPTFLTRVIIENYKSIAACDVRLGPLTYLVGRNGSGKSNFLDALHFVADSTRYSLATALRERGGIGNVQRRGSAEGHLGIRLEYRLPDGASGWYAFELARDLERPGGYRVYREECSIRRHAPIYPAADSFTVRDGQVRISRLHEQALLPPAQPDGLYLVTASPLPEFRPLYEHLLGMRFYNIPAAAIRTIRPPDPTVVLEEDGSNLPSVLDMLALREPAFRVRVDDYLRAIVPGLQGTRVRDVGPGLTVEFLQRLANGNGEQVFYPQAMSDGTLRALTILTALFQGGSTGEGFAPLVGIEEPEVELYPSAIAALRDALLDGGELTQVLVSTHSPILLDSWEVRPESLLAVETRDGISQIGPLREGERSIIADRQVTAGELLRTSTFRPATLAGTPSLFDA